jgi:hypothetical protein
MGPKQTKAFLMAPSKSKVYQKVSTKTGPTKAESPSMVSLKVQLMAKMTSLRSLQVSVMAQTKGSLKARLNLAVARKAS